MMKRRYLLPLLLCILSTFAGQVFANVCFFTKEDITIPDFWATDNTLIGPVGTQNVVPIMYPQSYTESVHLFTQSVINCSGGSTDNAVTLTAPVDASIVDSYTLNGMSLLKTNVAGIVYSYDLRCMDDCVHNANVNLSLPAPGQSVTSSQFNGSYADSSSRWDILVTLYQTPEYRPHPGQTTVQALPGIIGTVHMGPTIFTSKSMNLHITSGSVHFRLSEPTCGSVGIDGIDGDHEVNFGDFFASDVEKGGVTAEREFTFDLYRCSMNAVTLGISGPHDGTGNYLVNGTGNAEGVGIALEANISGSKVPVKVDGSATVGRSFNGSVDWYHEYYAIPFSAKLKKLGTIKAGSFTTTATFTLSYE